MILPSQLYKLKSHVYLIHSKLQYKKQKRTYITAKHENTLLYIYHYKTGTSYFEKWQSVRRKWLVSNGYRSVKHNVHIYDDNHYQCHSSHTSNQCLPYMKFQNRASASWWELHVIWYQKLDYLHTCNQHSYTSSLNDCASLSSKFCSLQPYHTITVTVWHLFWGVLDYLVCFFFFSWLAGL